MLDGRFLPGFAYNGAMGLVMAGGRYAGGHVERTRDGVTFQAMPPLPVELFYNCMVSVDNATLLSVGGANYNSSGWPTNATAGAYMYHSSTSEWTEVAPMSMGRYGHSCGIVDNGLTGKEVIVVGGTDSGGRDTKEVEVYSISTGEWRKERAFLRGTFCC